MHYLQKLKNEKQRAIFAQRNVFTGDPGLTPTLYRMFFSTYQAFPSFPSLRRRSPDQNALDR